MKKVDIDSTLFGALVVKEVIEDVIKNHPHIIVRAILKVAGEIGENASLQEEDNATNGL